MFQFFVYKIAYYFVHFKASHIHVCDLSVSLAHVSIGLLVFFLLTYKISLYIKVIYFFF